jgi:hypothetical protein
MRPFRVIIALLSAAFIVHLSPPAGRNLNNSTGKRTQVQAVQAKLIENKPQAIAEEKAPTEPTAPVEPEIVREAAAVETPKPQPTGGKYDLMAAAGISPDDYQIVDDIVTKESGWQAERWNTQGSGAYGLCQALPASKMADAGDDYMTNPVTQLKWCDQYAKQYGGWHGSKQFRDCTGWCFSSRVAATVFKNHTWW